MLSNFEVGKIVIMFIFKEIDCNLIGVFYCMYGSEGILLLLFDFEKVFRLVFDNEIVEDFVLYEIIDDKCVFIYDYIINKNVFLDSYISILNFFDWNWEIMVCC